MGVFQNNLMGAAAAAASAGGGEFYTHQIANSVRNSLSQNGTLKRTAGTPTSRDVFTLSYWVKKYTNTQYANLFTSGTGGGTYFGTWFTTAGEFNIEGTGGNWGSANYLVSTALYRDNSAWYHVVTRFDSTESTGSDRVRLYINGVEQTSFSNSTMHNYVQNTDFSFINESGVVQSFGGISGVAIGSEGSDTQLAEIVFNDGQSYGPDSYGETKNGVWIPKDPSGLTFGDNGYWLKLESSSDLGNDSSGNNNDFTAANLSAHDQMLDSPTFNSDSNGGNFATYNPLSPTTNGAVFTEGNLKSSPASSWSATTYIKTTMAIPKDKKIYFEASDAGSVGGLYAIGVATESGVPSSTSVGGAGSVTLYDTYKYVNGTGTGSWITGASAGDIIQVAVDGATGKVWLGINNTWGGSGDPAGDSNEAGTITNTLAEDILPVVCQNLNSNLVLNFGQDGTFAGNKTAQGNADGTGYGNFYYAPPSGFLALCTGNLSTADAVDPAQTDDNYPQKLFAPKLYTGDGATTLTISGMDLQPDFTWIKNRDAADGHCLFDSTRGVTKLLASDSTAVEVTDADTLKSWTSDGYTVGADIKVNTSGEDYVGWNWRANGGTTSTNNDGSHTSVVQVDPASSFSIMTCADPGGAVTIGHGLGVKPAMYILKGRSGATSWGVYHESLGATKYLLLESIAAAATGSQYFNDTEPTTSVLSLGATWNGAGTIVAYAFANVEGYCKAGSYEGNGSADGTFVYTGFKPALILIKDVDDNQDPWALYDNKRPGYNVTEEALHPNTTAAETDSTSYSIDLLSNGFKLRTTFGGQNATHTYMYLAISFNPFQYATAR